MKLRKLFFIEEFPAGLSFAVYHADYRMIIKKFLWFNFRYVKVFGYNVEITDDKKKASDFLKQKKYEYTMFLRLCNVKKT